MLKNHHKILDLFDFTLESERCARAVQKHPQSRQLVHLIAGSTSDSLKPLQKKRICWWCLLAH